MRPLLSGRDRLWLPAVFGCLSAGLPFDETSVPSILLLTISRRLAGTASRPKSASYGTARLATSRIHFQTLRRLRVWAVVSRVPMQASKRSVNTMRERCGERRTTVMHVMCYRGDVARSSSITEWLRRGDGVVMRGALIATGARDITSSSVMYSNALHETERVSAAMIGINTVSPAYRDCDRYLDTSASGAYSRRQRRASSRPITLLHKTGSSTRSRAFESAGVRGRHAMLVWEDMERLGAPDVPSGIRYPPR
jgi:hypothetical protein